MLPLVGLLALGLLILGVRLLFFQTPEEFSMGDYSLEEPVSTSEPARVATDPAQEPPEADETGSKPVVAVPVEITEDEKNGSSSVAPGTQENRTEAPAGPEDTQAKPEQPRPEGTQQTAPSATTSTVTATSPSGGFWGVQVGAFTVRESAETVAGELRGDGYEAFVIPAEVGGKQYYRVRVKAGDNRKAAEQMESSLASKGYPTLVTYQD